MAEVIAERIRERMSALGLNPNSAATRADLKPSFIRDILRGKAKHPSAERLAKLAETLQCSVGYLLGHDEEQVYSERKYDEAGGEWKMPAPIHRPFFENAWPSPNLLPIKYELMTGVFRRRVDIEVNLSSEPASIVLAHHERRQWFEVVRDSGADLIAPEGSLLQVAEFGDDERHLLKDGDVVIVERHMIGPKAAYYTVERSVRIIRYRYPHIGLWFFEYASADVEYWGESDDVFRNEKADPTTSDAEDEAFKELALIIRRQVSGISTEDAANNEAYLQSLIQQRKMRPRVVGLVLRAVVPIARDGGFGLAAKNES